MNSTPAAHRDTSIKSVQPRSGDSKPNGNTGTNNHSSYGSTQPTNRTTGATNHSKTKGITEATNDSNSNGTTRAIIQRTPNGATGATNHNSNGLQSITTQGYQQPVTNLKCDGSTQSLNTRGYQAQPVANHRSNLETQSVKIARTNLIINFLPYTMTKDELKVLFSSIGEVKTCRVISVQGEPRGYGFVDFVQPQDAAKAVRVLNGLYLGTKKIKVSFALPPGEHKKREAVQPCFKSDYFRPCVEQKSKDRKNDEKCKTDNRIVVKGEEKCKTDKNIVAKGVNDAKHEEELEICESRDDGKSNERSDLEVNKDAREGVDRSNGVVGCSRRKSGDSSGRCDGTESTPHEAQQVNPTSMWVGFEYEQKGIQPEGGVCFEGFPASQQIVSASFPESQSSNLSSVTPVEPRLMTTYYQSAVIGPYEYHESFESYPESESNYDPYEYTTESPENPTGEDALCVHGNPEVNSSEVNTSLQEYVSPNHVNSSLQDYPSPNAIGIYMGPPIIYSWTPTPTQYGHSIFVSNLHPKCEDLDLWKMFGPFGAVTSAKVVKDKRRGLCKGFGFVTMTRFEEACVAVQILNECTMYGKRLQVAFNRYVPY